MVSRLLLVVSSRSPGVMVSGEPRRTKIIGPPRRDTPRDMSEAVTARVRTIPRFIYAAIAVLILVADQLTKKMVQASIPPHAVIPVVPHFFNLTNTQNSGAAFGLFSGSSSPWKPALLILVSGALLVTVIGIVWRSRMQWEAGVGLSLILGGASSNLWDRISRGRVVDFLDFYFRSYHWFTFNLADSAIVVGAGFLILKMVWAEESH
jgi:signal peptidase II